ncbi:alcohol dehydrogenase [Sodiomyces alkalinus F11]|uniref:Alcohol dehydrogenase n=1 Tax=Sodiomyces alkalinus (strain CBS 110278 / VKM F-3762 / F11) TaxID=1314773 RepID=A0A3N2PU32_SODAK|nr:alcohol dehydrogenase [Sodiomyces alkalinus F11]ROT38028.1 alcohol dehydrogenase [Sodiomyces alkalinus F11]
MGETEVQKWQTQQDGFGHLTQSNAPMPKPGKDEVLVKINAVSLNYRDTEVVMGLYNHHKTVESGRPDPIVPCSDMCGTVVAVGESSNSSSSDVTWKVGDRVLSTFNQSHLSGQIQGADMATGLGLPLDGVLQTYRVFPATGLVRAPSHLSDEEAACLPIAAVTAWMAINQFRPLGQPGGAGETVLLQGTGGVSVSGLQIAHAAGGKTIVTSSSDAKLERAKKLGADHVINYRTNPDWENAVMEMTGGRGADIILECGGAQTLRKSFDAVAFGGAIACIGYVSGKQDAPGDRTNVNLLALLRNVTLKGIINGPRDRFEEMIRFYEAHGIHPVVDKVFGFEEAVEAFEYLFQGSHFGKVVIKVGA